MKSLKDYIYKNIINNDILIVSEEKDTTKQTEPPVPRTDIMFDIWEEPNKKVNWIKDNFSYTKIEYQYISKDGNIEMDFLLGFKSGSWRLWVGKIGAVDYSDESYCDLKCVKLQDAIMNAIDKIEELVKKVKNDPKNYVMYYINI